MDATQKEFAGVITSAEIADKITLQRNAKQIFLGAPIAMAITKAFHPNALKPRKKKQSITSRSLIRLATAKPRKNMKKSTIKNKFTNKNRLL